MENLRNAGYSIVTGILAGVVATVFLALLHFATNFRDAHPEMTWLLPAAGFFIGWIYFRYGKDIAGGTNLILEEIHDPKNVTPLRMTPLILLGTLATHLFGGSAGREGTAVQMGASLSDQLSKFFRLNPNRRKTLLIAGAGAGFGAAIGTPWAGVVFGMEMLWVGWPRPIAVLESILASFSAFFVTQILHAPHSHYAIFQPPRLEIKTLLWVTLSGAAFGLSARAFSFLAHGIEQFEARIIHWPPLKPALAGLVLVVLYALEGSYRYVGLGIPQIQEAFLQPSSFRDPFFKTLFTALTVASGFKGGEFIPLVFIGATLGSALSIFIPVPLSILTSVGFAAVFAGAANAPIACSIMAIELFGSAIAPYALCACLTSYAFSGRIGIYKSQK